MIRALPLVAFSLAALACGDDATRTLGRAWTETAEQPLAPPAIGPERRVILARRAAPGAVSTHEARDGRVIEGPFDALPTEHAPVAVGAEIYLVAQVSGRLVRLDLAGRELETPDVRMGATGPLVAGPDGSLRVVANAGTLYAFPGGAAAPLEAAVPGVSDSPPAVAPDGTAYVATDTGDLVGIDAAGQRVFEATVAAPASGPSVAGDRVAVGALDGVVVFTRGGQEVFRRARGARVVGTRLLPGGDLLAWGEDGRLERLGPGGEVRMQAEIGPPIYAEAFALDDDHYAVVDAEGFAHLVSPDGEVIERLEVAPEETGAPLRQLARGAGALVYVSRGRTVQTMDFGLEL